MSITISPSLLSANFLKLEEEIQRLLDVNINVLHIDVMDGHFVPNLTFGPPLIAKIKKQFPYLTLDVHLMIKNAESSIDQYIEAGADWITFHYEAVTHHHRFINYIKAHQCNAGISLNPSSPVSLLKDLIPSLDMVLIMSVNPGYSGQAFIPESISRIGELSHLIKECDSKTKIAVDGGVSLDNATTLKNAGADILVSGSTLFSSAHLEDAVKVLTK